MDHRWLALFVITLAGFCLDKSSGSDDEERLVKDILTRYNRHIRPVNAVNETVQVEFTLILSLLINVQEQKQIMKTNVWLQFKWVDPQLKWDPALFGGIQSIRLPFEKIWMPDIVLINNADGKYSESYKCNLVVYADGNLLLLPPSIYQSTCDINVSNFPFDEQECEMKFQSWTYHAEEVMLNFNNKKNTAPVEMTSYQKSGTWSVVKYDGKRNIYRKSASDPVTVDITYTLVIRRKPLFYLVNLVVPTVLVSFLSVLVFYLPTVAGEKVALSISILLTLNVFLLLVSKLLPPASALPLIGKFLLFTFLMNLVSIVITVITINLNFRSPKTHVMPVWIRKVFLHYLPCILGMRRPKRRRRVKMVTYQQPDRAAMNHQEAGRRAAPRTGRSAAHPAPGDVELREFSPADMTSRRMQQAGASSSSGGLPASGSRHFTERETTDPFASSSTDLAGEESDELSLNSPDARLVTSSIACIVQYHQQNDALQEVEEDWKYVALVVDRLLLWIFFIATTIGSIKILLSADKIFEPLVGDY